MQSLRRGGGRGLRRCLHELAYATDPTSAFGGIIAFNRTLDAATAKAILDRQFVEVTDRLRSYARRVRSDYRHQEANVRVLPDSRTARGLNNYDSNAHWFRPAAADRPTTASMSAERVEGGHPRRARPKRSLRDLLLPGAWPSTSNPTPLAYAKDNRTIGVGAGQMSRVYSARPSPASRPPMRTWWCLAR